MRNLDVLGLSLSPISTILYGYFALVSGAFNNYVDLILPDFDHLPPRVEKHEYFTYYLHFVTRAPVDFLLATYPPLLVHVLIECPLLCDFQVSGHMLQVEIHPFFAS